MIPFKIVSLGSGDPENITVKALNTLNECDTIFAPSGEAVRMLHRLATHTNLLPKVKTFDIPMQKESSTADKVYHDVAKELLELQQNNMQTALVTIGDSGIYSSAHKVADILSKYGSEVEVLSGIPSFVEAMARFNQPLVEQGQNLTVLSSLKSTDELLILLEQNCVVVIMKLSLFQEEIKKFLKLYRYKFAYIEKIGAPDEFMTSDLSTLLTRQIPYFSIITIKPCLA